MDNAHTNRNEVFLAEDSAAIRARLAAMLAGVEGVTVVGEADTPEGAIEGILRTRPRSVILDIHLIGGNGIDVLRKVHSVDPSIMFIVLTNHPSPQYSRIFTSAGASYFLDKNADFQKVKGIVADLAIAH